MANNIFNKLKHYNIVKIFVAYIKDKGIKMQKIQKHVTNQ